MGYREIQCNIRYILRWRIFPAACKSSLKIEMESVSL